MPENIFQQQDGITTSITGLTCKPLTILSETISPQEMSRTRGGNGCNNDDDDDDPIDMNTTPGPGDIVNTFFPSGDPVTNDMGTQGPAISPAELYNQGEPADAYLYGLTDDPSSADPYDENFDQNKIMDDQDRITETESGYYPEEGDCGEGGDGDGDGEDDDSSWLDDIWDWLTDEDEDDEDDSGLDGMEGDFDLSENEMFT